MFELLFWGAVLIAALAVEFHTAALVSVWFAVGAVGAYIVSLFSENFTVQLVTFTAVSAISLALSFFVFKKTPFRTKNEPTNAGLFVGRNARVTEEIDNAKGVGRVILDDVSWIAVSENGEKIAAESIVKVISVKGAKLSCAAIEDRE